jgi:hypothetical protein
MDETLRGPQLRNFSQSIGLLNHGEDFADRRSTDGRITVRQARTFIVNYYEGIDNQSKNLSQELFVPYLCKAGQIDPKYLKLFVEKKELWKDQKLIEAGKQFVKLHQKQYSIISSSPDLNTGTLRNKAISFAVLSSWAFVAGILQNNPERLQTFYHLPDSSGRSDPLNADTMTASRSARDPVIYRGLAVRDSEVDRGRVTELFLEYSDHGGKITKKLCETAIASHDVKVAGKQLSKLKGK